MLKPSKKAGGSPLINEGKAHGAGRVAIKPNSPLSTKNRVIISGPGSGSGKKTFTAPPKGDDMNPSACGYTKLK